MAGGRSWRSGDGRAQGVLPTHPGSHIGLLTPDPEDRIQSDLVPHLLSQVLGSLDSIQSLGGEQKPGLQTELSDRSRGSRERKG